MAMITVNPVEEKQKKSALENAANILGIVTTVGNLGLQGYQIANPVPSEADKLSKLLQDHLITVGGKK